MFRAHFRSGLVSRGQLQIIAVDSRRCREAPGSCEVKLGNCGDIGISLPIQVVLVPTCSLRSSGVLVPVPNQCGTGTQVQLRIVRFWYRYHTNWYRYQNAIFAGFKRNFDLGEGMLVFWFPL